MIIDAHLHLLRRENFDLELHKDLDMRIPEDINLDDIVSWLKAAGVEKVVCMGQDMSRIWNTEFGEEYLREAYMKYPDFIIPLASVEPLDKVNRFNRPAFDYLRKALDEYGFRGVLFTPPYGHYDSNDKTMYPFYELLHERNAVVQYHHSAQIGPAILAPTRHASMFNLNDVIVDFPNMKIVVEHLGYPWSEHLFALMLNNKNLYTDLALMFGRPTWIAWNMVLAKEYGVIDRVMYGSDFVSPNYDLVGQNPAKDFLKWMEFIKVGINTICEKSGWPVLSESEIEGILGNNAARLYGII